jgi:hypothetical protein
MCPPLYTVQRWSGCTSACGRLATVTGSNLVTLSRHHVTNRNTRGGRIAGLATGWLPPAALPCTSDVVPGSVAFSIKPAPALHPSHLCQPPTARSCSPASCPSWVAGPVPGSARALQRCHCCQHRGQHRRRQQLRAGRQHAAPRFASGPVAASSCCAACPALPGGSQPAVSERQLRRGRQNTQ